MTLQHLILLQGVSLQQDQVLYEAGDPLRHATFPHDTVPVIHDKVLTITTATPNKGLSLMSHLAEADRDRILAAVDKAFET